MIIVGAKGFAKEVLEILHQNNQIDEVVFYDDINNDLPKKVFNQFEILTSNIQAKEYFQNVNNQFTIGIGNPILRKKMFDKFISIGGEFVSTISLKASIGSFNVFIKNGANILDGAIISNSVTIGMGVIVYYNANITHDCLIGDFVEISPGATILGRSKIGDYSQIGANSTILPDVMIGKNVIVGAGSVVTKSVPDNSLVVGIPAIIIKELEPIDLI